MAPNGGSREEASASRTFSKEKVVKRTRNAIPRENCLLGFHTLCAQVVPKRAIVQNMRKCRAKRFAIAIGNQRDASVGKRSAFSCARIADDGKATRNPGERAAASHIKSSTDA